MYIVTESTTKRGSQFLRSGFFPKLFADFSLQLYTWHNKQVSVLSGELEATVHLKLKSKTKLLFNKTQFL